jgi:cell division protein FtsL
MRFLERIAHNRHYRRVKAKILYCQRAVQQELRARWRRYSRLEKTIILAAAIQAAVVLVGILIYVPYSRRQTVKSVQKKIGSRFLRRVLEQEIITLGEWLLSLPLMERFRQKWRRR